MRSFIDLDGYRILVTGASTGIGAAVARVLQHCGARLCLHANTNIELVKELATELGANGRGVEVVGADLSSAGRAAGMVDDAVEALGGLDVLINNAGAMVRRAPLAEYDNELFDEVFALNTRSVLEACRQAYPTLAVSQQASIINVGSIAGRNGGAAGSGIYAAAKAAVHSITRSLAAEFGPEGIRVNAVAPGVILTPFHSRTSEASKEATRQAVPLGRLGTPEECAWAFAFLACSQMSGYVTGQIIDINGGQLRP